MLELRYPVLAAALVVVSAAAGGPARAQQAAPAGAMAYFANLHDGDTVISPFKVVFGLSPNMGVAPSGIDKPNVGHHHLLIDTRLAAEELTRPITVDEQHVHFGKGQTETMLTLPPGKHTLQLMLGDWTHVPFKAPVQSEVITINVKAAEAAGASPAAGASTATQASAGWASTPPGKPARPAPRRHHHAAMVFKALPSSR
jgi:hypothetical protein